MIYEIIRSTSLSYLSIKSWPSSCIDDSDKPPSKTRHEATNARLIYTACKAFCTAQRSCSAFRGRTAAALIWLLILGQMFSVMFSRDEYFVYILLSIQILLVVDKVHVLHSLGTHPTLSLISVPLQTLA